MNKKRKSQFVFIFARVTYVQANQVAFRLYIILPGGLLELNFVTRDNAM